MATNRLSLKAISLVLGYSVWVLLSQHHSIRITIDVPLCFYNTENDLIIHAPETIAVTLEGKRDLLRYCNTKLLAAHIDCMNLHEGTNIINISAQTLFLPEQIKLVHYPSPMLITIEKQLS